MRRAGQLRVGLLLVAGALALAVCVVAMGQGYQVTSLGWSARPYAINNSGWAVGEDINEGGHHEACLWVPNGAGMEKVELGWGVAHDINNLNQVVGESYETHQACLWRLAGTTWTRTDLPLDGFVQSQGGYAYAISDTELIVGCAFVEDAAETQHACVWQILADGSVSPPMDLGALTPDTPSSAHGVNNAGWVVGLWGSAPCLWKPDTENLGNWLPPAIVAEGGGKANGVNDAGEVVGERYLDNDNDAFRYDGASGQVQYLEKVGGCPWPCATAISNATPSVTVGFAGKFVGDRIADWAAFTWQDGVCTDLSPLLTADPYFLEWSFAEGVNDYGQIVGHGTNNPYTGSRWTGYTHSFGFVLTPVSAPPVAPIAEAGGPYSTPEVPGTITFDGSDSYDPDGVISWYIWDFGDQSPLEEGSALTAPVHTYAAGSYTATLLVMDDDGYTDLDTAAVTIGTPPTPTIGASVDMTAAKAANKWRAIATVTVVDAFGAPVSGATVSGAWTGAYSGASSGVTDAAGQVTLTSGWVKGGGTFTFTVTTVSCPGKVWDGVQASGTIIAP